jgi:hypothetical protein
VTDIDVFLVPMGGARHELYCETAQPVDDQVSRSGMRGWWQRAAAVFRRAVAEGEAERDRRQDDEAGPPRGKLRRLITRKLAEAVAEQRLLWHLRKATGARLIHPDDLDPARALDLTREQCKRDHDKHRLWCVIDALLTVASTPIALLPGPNVLAYYFIFRTVGHYFSMHGARRGMAGIDWTTQPSAPLTAIRQALDLDAADREPRIDELAAALGLERLGAFVGRASGPVD